MARFVVDTTAEWDVVITRAVGFAGDLDATLGPVEIVYRRVPGSEWEPFLMVTQSYALRSIGIVHRGLYALKEFHGPRETKLSKRPGDRIGRYGGEVLATFPDIKADDAKEAMTRWAREGRGSLLMYRINPGEGISVLDGHGSDPPYMYRINDAHNTGRPTNVRFGETGYTSATRFIPAADLQAGSLAAIAASELLVSYEAGGHGSYWDLHNTLGQQNNPITFERRSGANGLELPLLALRL